MARKFQRRPVASTYGNRNMQTTITMPSRAEDGAERRQRLATVPETQRGVFKRAYSGKSRVAAIKAKCLDCCGYQRPEVKSCGTVCCPLWNYRPYQTQTDE